MPRGDKSKYTDKQKRQAEHIAEGYEQRGDSPKTAKRKAWATVNKETGGGKKSGSGRGKKVDKLPSREGGRNGGQAAAKKKRKGAEPAGKKSAAKKRAQKTGGRKKKS